MDLSHPVSTRMIHDQLMCLQVKYKPGMRVRDSVSASYNNVIRDMWVHWFDRDDLAKNFVIRAIRSVPLFP